MKSSETLKPQMTNLWYQRCKNPIDMYLPISRGGGLLYIFWVRGRAIGKGIDFHDFGIRNGIDFHGFGIRNGINFHDFGIFNFNFNFNFINITCYTFTRSVVINTNSKKK